MIYTIVYLTGYVASYFLQKLGAKINKEKYTKRHQLTGLITSLFSWLSVIVFGLFIIDDMKSSYLDKDAKW